MQRSNHQCYEYVSDWLACDTLEGGNVAGFQLERTKGHVRSGLHRASPLSAAVACRRRRRATRRRSASFWGESERIERLCAHFDCQDAISPARRPAEMPVTALAVEVCPRRWAEACRRSDPREGGGDSGEPVGADRRASSLTCESI